MADDGGLQRLTNRLSAIPGRVKEAAVKAVVRQAELMAKQMKKKVPVDSGALRDSIVVTPPNSNTPPYSQPGGEMVIPETTAAITAGNKDVRYAHLVEYGTKERTVKTTGEPSGIGPAQPFFWPTFRERRPKAERAIKSAITRAVKKDWGK
ncbi:hypothetical protein GCM10011491_05630 [Brucella endophytica]|uniref:HK97 gp10 family phage protein n=1 Tax=Brucella endophytica TaxID=1963359 RepID=A0A916WAW7_9HYPH|nr:HK97-gp10 family putative phage morphogenesis protein [Brucella endophytica]GGA81206.1 hypothetical protein GCM10011491_05630 [Brucella endophytica]